jgi:hypothetical protein
MQTCFDTLNAGKRRKRHGSRKLEFEVYDYHQRTSSKKCYLWPVILTTQPWDLYAHKYTWLQSALKVWLEKSYKMVQNKLKVLSLYNDMLNIGYAEDRLNPDIHVCV